MADGAVRELIRGALDGSGLSARELAARAGVSEGRLSDYLHGRHAPGAGRLVGILEAAGFRLELVRDLDANGLVLAQLLELADALLVDRGRPTGFDDLPRFEDLIAADG